MLLGSWIKDSQKLQIGTHTHTLTRTHSELASGLQNVDARDDLKKRDKIQNLSVEKIKTSKKKKKKNLSC